MSMLAALLVLSDLAGTAAVTTLWSGGRSAYEQGAYDIAEDAFSRAVMISPSHPYSHLMLGLSQLKQNRPSEAVHAMSTAISVDPGYTDGLYALAHYFFTSRDYGRAAEYAGRAAARGATDEARERYRLYAGLLNLLANNNTEATRYLETLLIRSRESEILLAVARLRLGDGPGAMASMKRLIHSDTSTFRGLFADYVAWYLSQKCAPDSLFTKEFEETLLEMAGEESPETHSWAPLWAGALALKRGNYSMSIELFKLVPSESPAGCYACYYTMVASLSSKTPLPGRCARECTQEVLNDLPALDPQTLSALDVGAGEHYRSLLDEVSGLHE